MSKKKSSKSKKWTKKEDKIVIEMNLAGASHAEIEYQGHLESR